MVLGGEISDGAEKPQVQDQGPCSPLRKRVLSIPGSSSSSSLSTKDPSLSACHRCDLKTAALELLDSQWRVVLLCRKCLSALFHGHICSYCFEELSKEADLYLNCLRCFSRVHWDCIPNHRRILSSSQVDFDSFTCVDCFPDPGSRPKGGAAGDGADASGKVGVDAVDEALEPPDLICSSHD